MMKIPVLVCLDVEPDARLIDPDIPAPWRGFEKCFSLFRDLRKTISTRIKQPTVFNWFLRMDAQIEKVYGSASWGAEHYASCFNEFSENHDEIGLHTHAVRWDANLKTWIVDHGNSSWIEHCVRLSFQSFEKAFGRKCLSFRFGDRWMSRDVMRLIYELGARFDLTLEPGHDAQPAMKTQECHTGCLPDFRLLQRTPYYPSWNDFRVPDSQRKNGLITIPLTTGELSGFDAWLCRFWRRLKFGQIISGPKVCSTLHLNHYPRIFRKIMDGALAGMSNPYLTLIARTDIALSRQYLKNFHRNLKYLLSHPLAENFVFCTPDKAVKTLGVD